MKTTTKLYLGLLALCLLTPIGLLAAGTAWGEWEKEFFLRMIGYVPKGLDRFSEVWHAPFPDYTIAGTGEKFGYILSALGGVLVILLMTWAGGKILTRKQKKQRKAE